MIMLGAGPAECGNGPAECGTGPAECGPLQANADLTCDYYMVETNLQC